MNQVVINTAIPELSTADFIPRAMGQPSLAQMQEAAVDSGTDPNMIHDQMMQDADQEVQQWQAWITTYLESIRYNYDIAREDDPRGFKTRISRNVRRTANVPDVLFNPATLQTLTQYVDGHAELGITTGLSSQMVRTAGAHLNKREFGQTSSFIQFKGRGSKSENKTLPLALEAWCKDMAQKCGYEAVVMRTNDEVPEHGCSWLRCRPIRALQMIRDPQTGEFRERRDPMLRFKFERWPIQDVLVSNPSYPFAWDQEGVFFISRAATVRYLQEDEATFDIDPATGMPARISGRFFNIRRLADLEATYDGRSNITYATNTTPLEWASERAKRVSSFPKFELAEFEGSLPMYEAVVGGFFTPRLAKLFGVNIGPVPDPNDAAGIKLWGQRLNMLKWECSYISNTVTGATIPRQLVQFNTCMYPTPRNSLYVRGYFRNSDRLMGESVTDRIYRLEDTIDLLTNIATYRDHYSLLPTIFYDRTQLVGSDAANPIQLGVNKSYSLKPGSDANKAVQAVMLPDNPRLMQRIESLKHDAYLAGGVAQIQVEGMGSANTATGQQLENSKTENSLDQIFFQNVQETNRMWRDIVEQAYDYYGPQGFAAELARVSGRDAAGIMQDLPSKDMIWNEFDIDHPGADFSGDPVMMAASFLQGFTAFGGPLTHNMPTAMKTYYSLIGMRNSEDLLSQVNVLDVEDELLQMSQGNRVDPSTMTTPQDMQVRIAFMMAKLQELNTTGTININGRMLDPNEAALVNQGIMRYIQTGSQIMKMMQQNAALNSGQAQTEQSNQTAPSDGATQGNRARENEHRISTAGGEQTA